MSNTPPRFAALDGLRGVAALLVVLLHMAWPNHLTNTTFVRHGYLWVDLFFILSGLVIAANYSTRIVDGTTMASFVARRFFRLYPLHIAVLSAFVGLEYLKLAGQQTLGIAPEHQPFTGPNSVDALAAQLLLVHGYGFLNRLTWNFPSWSISCEFLAYVLFALGLRFRALQSRWTVVGGGLLALSAYGAIAFRRGTLDVTYDFGAVRCVAGFFLGTVIFRLSPHNRLPRVRHAAACEVIVALAVVAAMAASSGPSVAVAVPLFVVLIALLHSDRGPVSRLLASRPAQSLGRISYSLYMVHFLLVVCLLMVIKRVVPVGYQAGTLVIGLDPWVGDCLVLLTLVTVVAAAATTYRLIEEPGRLLGRTIAARIERRRPREVQAMPSPAYR